MGSGKERQNKMDRSHCYSYFGIEGEDFDPAKVGKALGIKPFKSRKAGQQRRNGSGAYEFSCFDCVKVKSPQQDVAEQVLKIVRTLTPLIPVLKELKERMGLKYCIMVVTHIYEEQAPYVWFGSEVVEFCHETGTEIGMDIYAYDKDDEV